MHFALLSLHSIPSEPLLKLALWGKHTATPESLFEGTHAPTTELALWNINAATTELIL